MKQQKKLYNLKCNYNILFQTEFKKSLKKLN